MSEAILSSVSVATLAQRADAKRVELGQAARDFSGMLLGQVLRQGTRPLSGETPLDGGSAGRMYRELFFEEMARLAASRDELRLGELLQTQLAPRRPGEEETR